MTQVVEFYVVMYCEDCVTSVKKAIKKAPGVESYKIDYDGQKVTVIGNVDRDDVWRRILKTGRDVMLIAEFAPPKEEPKKEEKKEETKEETKEEKKEEKKEEIKKEKKKKKKEKKEETKLEEKTEVTLEEQKTEETKIVGPEVAVKVEEVVIVVETIEKEEKQEPKVEEVIKVEAKKAETKRKEPARPQETEWVPMFVTAPYYTLPNKYYNY